MADKGDWNNASVPYGWLTAKGHMVQHYYNAAGSLCGIVPAYPFHLDTHPGRIRCDRCERIADEIGSLAKVGNSDPASNREMSVLRDDVSHPG